ncbi:MAG: aldolase [Bacillus sp. (in: Bacteria)]|nr:aldolase [Bacillus sp. (in: firmicutes)]
MLSTLKKVVYKAFGLQVISEIHLPELPQMIEPKNLNDVEITIGDLTLEWAKLVTQNEDIIVKENVVMFQIPSTAIFSIQEGNKIIVSPLAGFSEDAARLYLLGTCMGAILIQRKILPLHGSAIVINGKSYGFVGESGAGKSTLASAFINSGYHLLTDDVIAISLSKDGIPVVTPSYPQQKLWQESLNEFGMEIHQYRPLLERETKYAVPVASHFTAESIPLAGIFELVKTKNEEIEIHPIQGLERFRTLFSHTYRNFMIAPAGLMEWHFTTSASFVNKIELFQLCRPVSRFTAHELSALIVKTIQKGE